MRKLVLLASLLLILVPVLAFAQEGSSSSAYVRVAHFALNVDEVDVYINGNLRSLGRDKEFGWASSWLVVPAGEFEVAVTPAGRSLSTAIVEPTVVELAPDSRTTIVAIGDARATGVSAHVIEEDYADLGEYHSRVTILHANPDVGAVDLMNDGELMMGRMGYPGSITLADGGTNDGVTTVDLVAGSYDFAVVENGLPGAVVVDMSDTELAEQTFYLVVIGADEEGNPAASIFSAEGN